MKKYFKGIYKFIAFVIYIGALIGSNYIKNDTIFYIVWAFGGIYFSLALYFDLTKMYKESAMLKKENQELKEKLGQYGPVDSIQNTKQS